MINTKTKIILCIFVFTVVLFFEMRKKKKFYTFKDQNISNKHKVQFSTEDNEFAEKATDELKNLIENGFDIPKVDDSEINQENVVFVVDTNSPKKSVEGYTAFHAENTRYWPQYYYSFPYNYKYGGAWPPGMYSRLYFWSPGYSSGSGWSYYLRPGIGYKYYPRNRWIRNTTNGTGGNTYYYLTNRDDYTHNESNYSELPLSFM